MREHDPGDTTLWSVSAFERQHSTGGGFARAHGPTVLSSTLNANLAALDQRGRSSEVLEVLAACIRHRESALLLLRLGGFVWPLTLFPLQNLYHLPRSLIEPLRQDARELAVVGIEPPGRRPPALAEHPGAAGRTSCRPLPPLLWALAQLAPQRRLLAEIAGPVAYRITADIDDDGAPGGAMRSSLDRLRTEIATLGEIARWPGMDAERAARLLNGAYLQGAVIVLRKPAAARRGGTGSPGLFGWWRARR